MKKPAIPKKLLDKRIPTLLGMFVLVVALIAGTLLLGDGPGVFAPRATPSTTPQKIKVTNVTDNSFTVSFITDEKTPAFIKYGISTSDLKSQASDDRDQLTGTVGDYQTHHITVRGLQQNTLYYYTLGTGSGSSFDNGGTPFTITTAARNGAPAAAKTIYGSVSNQSGGPAEGAIVYVSMANAGDMSSLVKKSGSWAVPLSNARTKDGTSYAQITEEDSVILSVQGELLSDSMLFETTVASSQPVPTLTFGQDLPQQQTAEASTTPTPSPTVTPEPTPNEETPAETPIVVEDDYPVDFDLNPTSTESAIHDGIDETTTASQSASQSARTIVNVDISEPQQVTTTQPKIIGTVPPNMTISIEVNSDTQINQQVTADSNGNFELDIATLSENLEPGQHSVTYSYVDPNTGETVEKTVHFVVEDVQQLALNEPYGSGNPYPPATASPTPEASESAEASSEAQATDEGRVSLPASDEAVPVSGSVGTTLALVFGGLFFIISGLWSFWISHQLSKTELEF